MDRPLSVAVLGSCTTRDNFNRRFNPDYKTMWDCVLLQNQSSVISLMAPPLDLPEEKLGELGPFTRKVVVSDLTKSFLDDVVAAAPDFVVMDFFGDIHFGCLRVEGGTYLTDNRWHLWKTDYYRELDAAGKVDRWRIQDDTEAYVAAWQESFDRFLAHLRTHLPDTRVVVHRGLNVNRVRVGTGDDEKVMPLRKFKSLRALDVKRANALWRRLDDYALSQPGVEQVDLTHGGYTSYDEHPWGAFYVHYTPDYYRDFLAELNLLALEGRTELGEVGRTMLEQVVTATRAGADLRVERADRRVERLQRRVERLRGERDALRRSRDQGLLGAVRRALGRR